MCSFTGNEYIEQTVKAYSKSMLTAAFSILQSIPDSEDAVQEAFLKLLEKSPQFKDENHKKAWLLRVTINISKNMLKATKRSTLCYSEDIPYIQNNNDVLRCVMSLEEKYRTPIHLFYYEGYSIKEISSVLSLPRATIGTRLSRGRAQLKNLLKGEFDL